VMLIPLIFPRAVRATGLALTYSLGVAIFGGTATYVVTWLVGVSGDPLASTYYVLAANIVMLGAVILVPSADYGREAWPPPVGQEV
jgi:MFS transporter, MHS family, proline/betaine transporter